MELGIAGGVESLQRSCEGTHWVTAGIAGAEIEAFTKMKLNKQIQR